jgi:hypothetical protein
MKPLPHQPALSQIQEIRQEIATIAARYIAEDGATYAIAKHKAAQQVLGSDKFSHDLLPDNSQIEQQVHVHNQLFLSDTQPARLLHLRRLALTVMQELPQFNPHLSGSVLNGTAGEHAEIVIQLFVDNGKEVAIYLLNKNVQFEVSESQSDPGRRSDPVETYSFMRDNEGIHLVLLAPDDLRRGSAKKSPRANILALQKLIEESLAS